MIGSHNAGTFAKQRGITRIIPRCFSSCQLLTFEEQYRHGVRMFDIRVTHYNGDYYIAHGLIRYNLKLADVLQRIKTLGNDVVVGVMIEDTFLRFKGDVSEVSDLLRLYNIPMCYYLYKSSGEAISHNLVDDSRLIKWDIPSKHKGRLLIPKRDCKKINKHLNKSDIIASDNIHVIDFVEMIQQGNYLNHSENPNS